jgi:hypothetical protein
MIKDETVHHFITKGNIIEKTRPKMPYGHNRGEISEKTEYRIEYPGKDGAPSDQLRHPDHVNFGKNRFNETTHKKHYTDTRNEPLTKLDFDKTQGLKTEIRDISHQGHVLQSKEEHERKYKIEVIEGENNVKPGSWIRGRNEKKNLDFKDKTTFKEHYRGHEGKSADIQRERYDNLKPATNIPIREKTDYREKHRGKTPDVGADRELFGHNQTKGKHGHQFLVNPDHAKHTAYHKHFNETLKVGDIQDKPHFGKDDKTRDFLYQYHGGYYHTDG